MLICHVLAVSEEQKKFTLQEKARQASEHFCQAEQVTSAVPFTWLFIKPPWAAAPNALSCKSFVFEDIKERAEGAHPKVIFQCLKLPSFDGVKEWVGDIDLCLSSL